MPASRQTGQSSRTLGSIQPQPVRPPHVGGRKRRPRHPGSLHFLPITRLIQSSGPALPSLNLLEGNHVRFQPAIWRRAARNSDSEYRPRPSADSALVVAYWVPRNYAQRSRFVKRERHRVHAVTLTRRCCGASGNLCPRCESVGATNPVRTMPCDVLKVAHCRVLGLIK